MRILLPAVFAVACLLAVGYGPASAGSVNGMQQAYVCDATTNQGNNCIKPNSDGSINVSGTISAGGVAQGSTTSGQSGNLTQGAVTTSAPTYTTGQTNPLSLTTAGGLRTSETNSAAILSAVTGAVPAGTNVIGYTTNDPCGQATKSGAPFSLTASGQVITGTSAKKTYICSIDLVSATAQNIALVEGTGSTCATNIYGLAGGTTAATGWNLAANGGLAKGNGLGTVYIGSADANATAANVCLLLSSTGQTSGMITYVQQ